MKKTSASIPEESVTRMPWYKRIFYSFFSFFINFRQPKSLLCPSPEYLVAARKKEQADYEHKLYMFAKTEAVEVLKCLVKDYSKGNDNLVYSSCLSKELIESLRSLFILSGLTLTIESYESIEMDFVPVTIRTLSISQSDFISWYKEHGENFIKAYNIKL